LGLLPIGLTMLTWGNDPGSMPVAREIFQEGLIIPPVKLFEAGNINQSVWN